MNRRHFLRGLFATPAIVAASSLMPVRGIIMPVGLGLGHGWVDAVNFSVWVGWATEDDLMNFRSPPFPVPIPRVTA